MKSVGIDLTLRIVSPRRLFVDERVIIVEVEAVEVE